MIDLLSLERQEKIAMEAQEYVIKIFSDEDIPIEERLYHLNYIRYFINVLSFVISEGVGDDGYKNTSEPN